MNNEDAIEQFQNAIDLIKQNGKDWLDERDIPMLEMAIKALSEKSTINSPKTTINPEETELKLISTLSAEEEIAHWIISGTKMYRYKKCSKCKCMVSFGDMWKFCPMCGAKMKEPTKAETEEEEPTLEDWTNGEYPRWD